MIFAGGEILPDRELYGVLSRLEQDIPQVLSGPSLEADAVLNVLDSLGSELDSGALDPLIVKYAPPGAREELERAAADCETLKKNARGRLERAAQLIVGRVVER